MNIRKMQSLSALIVISGIVLGLGMANDAVSLTSTPMVLNNQKLISINKSTFARVGYETNIPPGWVGFCFRNMSECNNEDVKSVDITLDMNSLKKISEINEKVNREISQANDIEIWGKVDHWDYPRNGKGDCEDFALLKRKLLIRAGFPRQALLITIVRQESGNLHSVLTVKTDKGEYILDNLVDDIKPWTSMSYHLVKRQSQENQNVWITLG